MKSLSLNQLLDRMLTEYQIKDTIFSLPKSSFFRPNQARNFSGNFRDKKPSTPFGPAAGPHTQLTTNIISAWLMGARIIELKTIQIMDELDIPKPCIDTSNVCYNVEWSQELKIYRAREEYVKAWMLIHFLQEELIGTKPSHDQTVFDLSVGYDLKGIQSPTVKDFINTMKNASQYIEQQRQLLSEKNKRFKNIDVPNNISSGVTLSTFHGCPPTEIENIAKSLLTDYNLDTVIKLNPTLLGEKRLNEILHDHLGYNHINVPSSAFVKDLQMEQAVGMIERLKQVAKDNGRIFGVKFSNTLVVHNDTKYLEGSEKYMSGRPLHVLAMTLVNEFRKIFGEQLPISFSAGIDAKNVVDAVSANLMPITVCTDILRPGGYQRFAWYRDKLEEQMKTLNVETREDFILEHLSQGKEAFKQLFNKLESLITHWNDSIADQLKLAKIKNDDVKAVFSKFATNDSSQKISKSLTQIKEFVIREYKSNPSLMAFVDFVHSETVKIAGLKNSDLNLKKIMTENRYKLNHNDHRKNKINQPAKLLDCVTAPCIHACPVNIDIPSFIEHIKNGNFAESHQLIREANPLPAVCGRVCTHPCEDVCRQGLWSESVDIKNLKRFAADEAKVLSQPLYQNTAKSNSSVAIVGAGPAGLTCAYFLALHGIKATIFEKETISGGLLKDGIPSFRLPELVTNNEIEEITKLGVKIVNNQQIHHVNELTKLGHSHVFLGTGACEVIRAELENEDHSQCFTSLDFLKQVRLNSEYKIKGSVFVVGGGNAAIDCARTANRLGAKEVTLLYRRTQNEMPADKAEIQAAFDEGVKLLDLANITKLNIGDNNQLKSINCLKNKLADKDLSGRRRPIPVEGSDFILSADLIIFALGQRPALDLLVQGTKAEISKQGYIKVNPLQMSLEANLYAGGDACRGADTVINAMSDGKRAAFAIIESITGQKVAQTSFVKPSQVALNQPIHVAWKQMRQSMPHIQISERHGFSEVETGFTKEQAQAEANRCLRCDLTCNICVEVCPNRAMVAYTVPTNKWLAETFICKDGIISSSPKQEFSVAKSNQVANIGALCNECGNCGHFCPQNTAPFASKYIIYDNLEDFQNTKRSNALFKSMDKRKLWFKDSQTLELTVIDQDASKTLVEVQSIDFSLVFSPVTQEIQKITAKNPNWTLDMKHVYSLWTMYLADLKLILGN